MNTRERFGNYVLLKKLAEDALGETFRAGRLGAQGIEQVTLLRVFNGPGFDSAGLWRRVAGHGEKQTALKSPNLGNGIDFGELQGVPYVVYDYISGKNLASLIEQSNAQFSPVPTDHALLITERIALGLAAAYENRFAGERLLHGFVVPHLVMISNEGEARLLGFEVASGLRDMLPSSAALRPFARYASPELLAGEPAHKADDPYSLGALLYELLTGEPLPAGLSATDAVALVDQARLAQETEPLPPAVAGLIKKSLAPRAQRIADSPSWHRTLSQLMLDQNYHPTTFNLAFFMHNLFRDDIDRESREIQAEKAGDRARPTLDIGPPPAASAAPPRADTVAVGRKEIDSELAADQKKGGKGALIGIAAALVLAAVGAGYWLFVGKGGKTPAADAAAAALPTETAEAAPAGPSQEEIQAELERMRAEMAQALAAQSEEMKQALAQQYESKLKDLQQQAEAAQKAGDDRRRKEQEAAIAAQQAAIEEQARRQAQLATETQPPPARANPPATETAPPATTTPAAAPPPPQAAATAPPRSAPPPVKTEPSQPEVKAPVRAGQLVQANEPGTVPPKLIKQAAARYPPTARRVNREATITIRVLVDENGKVIQVEKLGKKVGLGLDEAAEEAARESVFQPATKDGVRVRMWHSLRFDFRP